MPTPWTAEATLHHDDEVDWQQAIETMPQIVWITRPDGWHTHFNRKWLEFTGLTLEESLGFGWNPPFHPDDRDRAAERWARATATGEPYEIEYRLRRADGVYHWMLGRAMPMRDATGQVVRWFGTCTDIEDLKQAQDALEQSRALHRLAGSMARLGGWSVEVATERVAWSEEIYEILEHPRDEQPDLAESLRGYLPQHRPTLDAAIRACATEGTPFDLELQVRNHTGRALWVRVMGEARRDAAGTITHVSGALQDVTAQRRDRRDLEERVKELRALAAISGGAHELTDADALCEVAARSLCEAMQHPGAVGVLVVLDDVVAQHGSLPADAARFSTPVVVAGEAHGRIVVADSSGTGLLSEEEDLVTAVATTLGLWQSRHHAAEALRDVNHELNLANVQLAEAARVKDDLLSMASHELRTPLTPILGFLELFEERADNLDDLQRETVRSMRRNAVRMMHLVDDLLMVSRAAANVLVAHPEEVTATDLVQPVLDELGDMLAGVELDLHGCRLRVDPQHLQQVVTNLLTNATKYGAAPIEVRAVPTGAGRVTIEVADHGPGVPPDFRPRMWERFEQKDRGDRRTASGTGLGLAIVRLLAEANGGTVGYRDRVPSGAVFTVELPGVA